MKTVKDKQREIIRSEYRAVPRCQTRAMGFQQKNTSNLQETIYGFCAVIAVFLIIMLFGSKPAEDNQKELLIEKARQQAVMNNDKREIERFIQLTSAYKQLM